MSLTTDKEMAGLAPLAQAHKAIEHVLRQIHERPEVGWYLGAATQSFALLTEAYATIMDEDIEEVRERFACPNAKNPAPEEEEEEELTQTKEIEQMPIADRLELLQELRGTYCFRCGGKAPIKPCYYNPPAAVQFNVRKVVAA